MTTLVLVIIWQPKGSLSQPNATPIRITDQRPPSLLPSTTRRSSEKGSIEQGGSDELIEVDRDQFWSRVSGITPFYKSNYRIPQFWKDFLGIKSQEDATKLSLAIGDIVETIKRFDVEHAVEIAPENKPQSAIWVKIPALDPAFINQAQASLAATLASICGNKQLLMLYTTSLERMWKQVSKARVLSIGDTSNGYLIINDTTKEQYVIGVSHLE